ncbi:hypothetical protein Tco_0340656 [Tanacetum coccineum]
MFQQGEDLIECINKEMAFLSAVASRFPLSNNQLRTSSNLRNQATIQDGKVIVQQVQGRQNQSYAESQDAVIQDTNPSTPNDLLVPFFVEQITDHVAHLDKENQTNKMENDTLKQTLSNNVKEKESLSKTLTIFKTESKEKESKYIDKEIVLEKQNKELENIICKMYRSTQAMHMLMKPYVFYEDTHKKALGYQNLFHLEKAQRIQPTLYDGSVIAKEHAMILMTDDEDSLILEEESRSKILDK